MSFIKYVSFVSVAFEVSVLLALWLNKAWREISWNQMPGTKMSPSLSKRALCRYWKGLHYSARQFTALFQPSLPTSADPECQPVVKVYGLLRSFLNLHRVFQAFRNLLEILEALLTKHLIPTLSS